MCGLDEKGEILKQKSIANTRASLTALSRRHPGALMVNRRSQRRSYNTTSFMEAWERWEIPMPRVVEKPCRKLDKSRTAQHNASTNRSPIMIEVSPARIPEECPVR